MIQNKRVKRHLGVLFYILLLGLAIEVLVLVHQNRELKNDAALYRNCLNLFILNHGDKVPPIKVVDLNGIEHNISYEDSTRNTLLCVFNTHCPACREVLTLWEKINKNYHKQELSLIGLSVDEFTLTRLYLEENKLNFSVFVTVDSLFETRYRMQLVPQLVLIGFKGVVKGVWPGLPTKRTIKGLEKMVCK